jgi:UDP-glucose:(heptosyl)LPS alpha-1,3-glucosyltransferase
MESWFYGRESRSRILVAVSTNTAEDLATTFPNRKHAIRVIANGVDAGRFRPNSEVRARIREYLQISEDARLALFVGSEWGYKGLSLIVDALAEAPEWTLCVVGNGHGETVRRHAMRVGVGDRVRLIGESSVPEHYFAAADAFVLPSAYETFSLAALEAAATGLPVIGSNVGIIGDLVEAGGGILVEREPKSIAAALTRLAAAPDELNVLGNRARAFSKLFDWQTAVERYASLYRELSERRLGGRPKPAGDGE